jgi:MGT family glycosyltransferase
MARILVCSVPAAGHVNPLLPLVRALGARGHELVWYTGAKFRDKVERCGARFIGFTRATDYDDANFDAAFPGRSALRGIAQLKFDMMRIFIDNAPGEMHDIDAIMRDYPADVILAEPGMIGALFHSERSGTQTLYLGVLPLVSSSVDTAPFGFGLQPSTTPLGRARNRALNALVERVVFREVQEHWNRLRASLGLERTGWWMNTIERATVYMQQSVPGFEYPRCDLAANVEFIGPMPADPPSDWIPPPFWHELDAGKPVIHVTQGTIANETPDLIAPALAGLAHEDVLVVVTSGGRAIESLGLRDVPRNARIGRYLSYPELLPKTAVMVTNGGYGGVQTALCHGVPLVVAGASEDKPEVAARVAWAGVGINLRTAKPKPEAVRRAVRRLLDEPSYRDRARALAREYATRDPLRRAVALVEKHAISARPRAQAAEATPRTDPATGT